MIREIDTAIISRPDRSATNASTTGFYFELNVPMPLNLLLSHNDSEFT